MAAKKRVGALLDTLTLGPDNSGQDVLLNNPSETDSRAVQWAL